MAAKGIRSLLFLCAALMLVLVSARTSEAHNITAILDAFPDYAMYNSYLTETKVADEINSRETVTCLALTNAEMASLAAKHTLAAVKNALRLLTLLDYFDARKLRHLPSGNALAATLLQTTGEVAGSLGFVNITTRRGGRVTFAPVAPGANLGAELTKPVKALPYNLSVLEISDPITFPGLFDAPDAATANLTRLLEEAECKTFASLLASSGVLMMYRAAMGKGLTVLAPRDEAFKAPGVPRVATLSSAEVVALLQYHALPQYAPKATLGAARGPLSTLASSDAEKYELTVVSRGDDVALDTGIDTSRVGSTVLDDTPFCVLTVDRVLLPVELFGKAPAAAPGLAENPSSSAPGPAVEAPTPAEDVPERASPPAPPTDTAEDSPAEAPDYDDETEESDKAGAASLKPFGTVAAVALAAWTLCCELMG